MRWHPLVGGALLGGLALAAMLAPPVSAAARAATVSPRAAQPAAAHAVAARSEAEGLHVKGRYILNQRNQRVRLVGFNFSGAEYACEEGWGIFDTPQPTTVSPTIVAAMASWTGANAVRIPLDEQCWLGIGGVKAKYGGSHYRAALASLVKRLSQQGFAVILDLQGSAPGTESSPNQEEMPDAHSVTFWREVAKAYKGQRNVLFDLFNEPWPYDSYNAADAWTCWRDGGCVLPSQNGSLQYRAVGMDQLIQAVRSTGAKNIVMAGGLEYAESLDSWLRYEPHDPAHQLIASTHIYSFNQCSSPHCYNGALASVAKHVPLFIGEFGPDLTVPYSDALDESCPVKDIGNTGFDSALLAWAKNHGASWTAWSWNPWGDCWSLVKNFTGLATPNWGTTVRTAIRQQSPSHPA